MKVNVTWMERVLHRQLERMGRKNVLPKVTPDGWWECDMFSTTNAGYWSEHEIKTTRADYLNDFKKEMAILYGRRRSSRYCGQKGVETLNKHEMLAAGDKRGPSNFWFCMPEGTVDVSEIPDYAGLIEFPEPNSDNPSPNWTRYHRIVRKAPRLHGEKMGDELIEKILGQMVWRYRNAYFDTIPKLKREIRTLKKTGMS